MSVLSASSELADALERVLEVVRGDESICGYVSASASWQHQDGSMISLTFSIGEPPDVRAVDDDE